MERDLVTLTKNQEGPRIRTAGLPSRPINLQHASHPRQRGRQASLNQKKSTVPRGWLAGRPPLQERSFGGLVAEALALLGPGRTGKVKPLDRFLGV